MIGETSIAATMNTVVFVVKPPAAITQAPTRFSHVLILILALLLISLYNSSVVRLDICKEYDRCKHERVLRANDGDVPGFLKVLESY